MLRHVGEKEKKKFENLQIIVVDILFRYRYIRIDFQMWSNPIDGMIDFQTCSQWILGLFEWICENYQNDQQIKQ